jgi:hypothetical protein
MFLILANTRSLVMANAYAITHDESVYKDPDTFNPDRYLSVDGDILGSDGGESFSVVHLGLLASDEQILIILRCTEFAPANTSAAPASGSSSRPCLPP